LFSGIKADANKQKHNPNKRPNAQSSNMSGTFLADEEDVAKVLSVLPDISVQEAVDLLLRNGNNLERAIAEGVNNIPNALSSSTPPASGSSNLESPSSGSASHAQNVDPWTVTFTVDGCAELALAKPPVVEIFVANDSDIETSAVQDILSFFEERPGLVDKKAIRVFSGSGDSEVLKYVESFRSSARIYPLIRVHGNPIGDLHTLREIEERDDLEALLSHITPRTMFVSVEDEDGHLDSSGEGDDNTNDANPDRDDPSSERETQEEAAEGGANGSEGSLKGKGKKLIKKSPSGMYYGQSLLSSAIEMADTTLSTLAWAPIGIAKWIFGSGSQGFELGPNDVSFAVVHTNWLWCGMRRKLVITEKDIIRLNPGSDDVLDSRSFESIKSIVPVNDTYFAIHYNQGSGSSDYYSALPSDCNLIIETLISRSLSLGHSISLGKHVPSSPASSDQQQS